MPGKTLNIFIFTLLVLPAILLGGTVSAEEHSSRIAVANFSSISEQQLKKHWQPYNFSLFGSRSHYQLITHESQQVLRATSNKTASGLVRKLTINLKQYPILNWRWQSNSLPKGGDDHSKANDDHNLRLYVIFDSPQTSLLSWLKNATSLADTHAINYIWANQAPVGSLLANPYTGRSMMIAVNSGADKLGQWHTISRNVYADYQRAFGRKPPPVTAIAIMTDSDNTNSKLTSFYGNIYFSRQQAAK